MPWLTSLCSDTRCGSTGCVKLGQPVPESNLSVELNSGSPVATSTYSPGSWLFQNSLRNGGSVPAFCVISNCIGVSSFLSSAADGFLYCLVDMTFVLCEPLAGDGARDSAAPTPRNKTARTASAARPGLAARAAASNDLHLGERLASCGSIIP